MKKGMLIVVGLIVLIGITLGCKQTFVSKADDQSVQPVTVDWVNGQIQSRTDKLDAINKKLDDMAASINVATDTTSGAIKFTDVNYGVYATQVNWAVGKDIIRGYKQTDGTYKFNPTGLINRTHAAIMIAKAAKLTIPDKVTVAPFKDVKATDLYAPYIQAVKDAGIFNGSNGNFMPNTNLSRAQMATALVNAFKLKDNGKNIKVVDLNTADPSHQGNIQTLADLGITNLAPYNGDFRPHVYNTRLQLASFLYQVNQSIN